MSSEMTTDATQPGSIHARMPLDVMRERADDAVALLRSVGSQNRLMILCQLVEQERSVSQLVDTLAQAQSVVSQHLSVLRREGIVVGRRDGQSIHYRIADDRVRVLMQTLFQLFCQPDDKV